MNRKRQIEQKSKESVLVPILVPTSNGLKSVYVFKPKERSELGKYWNAVQHYLKTGDTSKLERLKGKQITTALGDKITLLTDLAELDRLGNAGVLSFESIYRK
jgi:hypothetical protein